MAEEPEIGDITPRKKPGALTYLVVGVIATVVIGGVMMFTGGNGDKPANGKTNPSTPTATVTIPQLKSSVDSLNAKVDGLSGRLANLETSVAGLSAPTVTKAQFDSLQASVNGLSAEVANWTEDLEALEEEVAIPVGGLNYYLFEDDGDGWLYILSDRDGDFIAQVTVAFENPISLNETGFNVALQAFYNQSWANDRDYTPSISYNTGSGKWEYTSITFYSDVLDLEKGEEEEYRVDLDELDNLDEDIDGIWIEVYPALETRSSGGLFN